MARRGLVDEAIQAILDRIIDGTFQPGSALPPEAELAELLEVSRPTMREAVRSLSDRGVLRVVHGRGSFVTDRDHWHDLGTIVSVLARTTSPRELGIQLTQVRRMLEVGAAGLAAENRTDGDVTKLRALLDGYDAAGQSGDVAEVADLDLAFHAGILSATGNPFITAIMAPLTEALTRSRAYTAAQPAVRARAQVHHRRILECIAEQDAQGAKDAMRAHMDQTHDDIAG